MPSQRCRRVFLGKEPTDEITAPAPFLPCAHSMNLGLAVDSRIVCEIIALRLGD